MVGRAGLVGHVGLMGLVPSRRGTIYEEDKVYLNQMI